MSKPSVRISISENPHDVTGATIDLRGTYFDGSQDILQVAHTFDKSMAIGHAYDLIVRKLKHSIGETFVERAINGGE